ncbi:inositol monophosphatase family protein [Wenzhouxiangella sp. XN24]|uniref:inositol monophosphatase family protein n=1 Tax=Wenzhouxiangella sp. XN24 TaxID=2713569 RepID=UPI0013EDE97A|nr:inositol monophosphatase family protein [Wenzhouxiangella sp. XN24]NGX15969.1 inositol-phosphate phosphatase [Wenzhouxiangella sp. XN24]
MERSRYLQVALEAAHAAAEVIRHYYRDGVEVSIKADATPVTRADVESEEVIRRAISTAFPDHGFYGEETGSHALDAEYLWLVDPIDGTRSFVRGYPFFSTQIALMHRGEIVVGVSSAPAFEQIAWAERGQGAVLDGHACRISQVHALEDAAVSSGNLRTLAGGPRWADWAQVVQRVARIRGYGDFYHYHLLAAGRIDAVLESDVNILDIAALSLIVTEAGGVFTDLDGGPVTLETTSVLAGNPRIYAAVAELMRVPG